MQKKAFLLMTVMLLTLNSYASAGWGCRPICIEAAPGAGILRVIHELGVFLLQVVDKIV